MDKNTITTTTDNSIRHNYRDLIIKKIKSYIKSITACTYDKDRQNLAAARLLWVDQTIDSIAKKYSYSESIFRCLLIDLSNEYLTIGDLSSIDSLNRRVEEIVKYGEVQIPMINTENHKRCRDEFYKILMIYSPATDKFDQIIRTINNLQNRLLDLCGSHVYYSITIDHFSRQYAFNKHHANIIAINNRMRGKNVEIQEHTLDINVDMITRLINLMAYDIMNGHIRLDSLSSITRFWLDKDGLQLLLCYLRTNYQRAFNDKESFDLYMMYIMTERVKSMRISKWVKGNPLLRS